VICTSKKYIEEEYMIRTLFICMMIFGLTTGCASTGGKSGQGEDIPLDAVEAEEEQ
jgi:hypothetical protein